MIHSLYDVVHVYRIIAGETDGVCLEDVSCLVVRQSTALDMVRVVGQVYLCLVIDAAFHSCLLLLTECSE